MRRLLFLSLAAAAWLGAAPRVLFNGKNLEGWIQEGGLPSFRAQEGELLTSGLGNHPNWIRSEQEFQNFRLSFEYRLAQWAEAAVVLRAPREGRPLQAGIAIMLAHDFHREVTAYVTGAVVGAAPPLRALPPSYEVWHRVEIALNGDRLTAEIDGQMVQSLDLASHRALRYRLKSGYLGFADLGHPWRVRNVRVEELPPSWTYENLFDGHSLSGWTHRGNGTFQVIDGVIQATGDGIHYAPGVYQNFELALLVKSFNRANGGVFLRGWPEDGKSRGFEIQIYSPPDAVYPTGSIYQHARSRLEADLEGRWFLLQVFVAQARCVVLVDGVVVAATSALPEAWQQAGRIGLQIHKVDAALHYRDIRIRPLVADELRPPDLSSASPAHSPVP